MSFDLTTDLSLFLAEFIMPGGEILAGTGSPEGVVSGRVGWLYTRLDGSGTLYTKASGTGTTGWTVAGGSGTITGTIASGQVAVGSAADTIAGNAAFTAVAGAVALTTLNGNTFTTGTYTLTGAAAKTLTFNNTLTLAGTDATTMTFPTTSATIARTDAGQTFTGVQVMTSANLITPTLGVASATSVNFGTSLVINDAANVLSIRNSTTAQTIHLYRTFTDASNYQRLVIDSAGIGSRAAGTGSAYDFALRYGEGTDGIYMKSASSGAGTGIDIAVQNLSGTVPTIGTVRLCSGNHTHSSGNMYDVNIVPVYVPAATSTMVAVPLRIAATINYQNATPGAGSYEALKIAVTETALPTGTSYLIRASAGAAGTTDKFTVTNGGNGQFAGTLGSTGAVTHSSTLAQNGDQTFGDGINIILNATTGTKIGTATTQKLSFYNATPVVQPVRGATTTNNVTSGGTDDTIANYTDLVIYANDAAAIRNNIYQLARIIRQHDVALRALGLES